MPDIPFEFVGKIASAGAVAEAGDIKSCSPSSRHTVARLYFKQLSSSTHEEHKGKGVKTMNPKRKSERAEKLPSVSA